MAYDDFLTMTPGSAVAGQLQQILTQKRLEARQAMMDQLASENIRSQISDRDQKAKTDEMYRQSLADQHEQAIQKSKADEDARRAGLLSPDQPLLGSDNAYWKERNPSMIVPGQPGAMLPNPTDVGPEQTATPDKWRGTSAQIETKRKTDAQIKAAEVLRGPDYPKMDPAQKAYWYEQATGKEPSAGLIKDKGDDYAPVFVNGVATGEWAPTNAIHMTKPNDPTPPAPIPYDVEDDQGAKHVFNVGRDGKATEVQFPTGFKVAGKMGTVHDPKPPKGVSERAKTNFLAAKQAFTKKGNSTNEASLKQAAATLISEYPAAANVKTQIQNLFNDPDYRKMPLDQFRGQIGAASDPQNSADAVALWQLLVQQ